jgi:hypothetical protein
MDPGQTGLAATQDLVLVLGPPRATKHPIEGRAVGSKLRKALSH